MQIPHRKPLAGETFVLSKFISQFQLFNHSPLSPSLFLSLCSPTRDRRREFLYIQNERARVHAFLENISRDFERAKLSLRVFCRGNSSISVAQTTFLDPFSNFSPFLWKSLLSKSLAENYRF